MTIHNKIIAPIALGLCLAGSGCTYVVSHKGGNSTMANDVWFTEVVGLTQWIPFVTRVYYCPPMANDEPSTCMRAEMIDSVQKTAPPAPAQPAATTPPLDSRPTPSEDPMGDIPLEEGIEGDLPAE